MKSQGYSLIEVVVTLTVLAIAATALTPSFISLLQKQRLESARLQLMGALSLTRQQAISQGRSIVLSRIGDSWSNGWEMIVDSNNNGRHDSTESILRSFPPLASELLLTGNQPVANYVRYMPDGQAHLLSGAFQTGTLTLCHTSNTVEGIQLTLSIGGRVRQSAAGAACR